MENYTGSKKMTWLEMYLTNYNGETPQAKALSEFTKQTYKNDIYVPWATMERLALTQDPDFDIEVVRTVCDNSLVDSKYYTIESYNKNQDKEIHSKVDIASHMIVLKGTFLNKTMFEYYPIQNSTYEAVKIIDQNLVNKSIQRGKTKLTSRLTGLALKLYEGLDLQFETKEAPTVPPKVEKKQKTVDTPKGGQEVEQKSEQKVELKGEQEADEIYVLARYLHENREVLKKGMEEMNAVLKQKGFTFDLDNDKESEIYDKLKNVKMPSIFVKAVKAKSGVQ